MKKKHKISSIIYFLITNSRFPRFLKSEHFVGIFLNLRLNLLNFLHQFNVVLLEKSLAVSRYESLFLVQITYRCNVRFIALLHVLHIFLLAALVISLPRLSHPCSPWSFIVPCWISKLEYAVMLLFPVSK